MIRQGREFLRRRLAEAVWVLPAVAPAVDRLIVCEAAQALPFLLADLQCILRLSFAPVVLRKRVAHLV